MAACLVAHQHRIPQTAVDAVEKCILVQTALAVSRVDLLIEYTLFTWYHTHAARQ